MVRATKTYKIGSGFDSSTTHGPVQNSMQYEKVKDMFAEIEKQKWNVAVGGKNPEGSKGYFITPTIIDNPPDNSRIVEEEPFGMASLFPINWTRVYD
jgi:acyl-CoA reductase-like NAD-dependent aldehyde dehydrogenase